LKFRVMLQVYSKMQCCFVVLMQYSKELRSILRYAGKSFDDPDFLGSVIRKNAHVLEKEIKNLCQGRTRPLNHELIYVRLKKQLLEWKEKGYKSSGTIEWSKKILREYERHLKSGWACELLGKAKKTARSTNDFRSLIEERRSIRHWEDREVTNDQFTLLVDAARQAPCSCNRQSWHFILVKDKELKSKIGRTAPGGDPFFSRAPLLIVVLIDFRSYRLPEEKYVIYQDAAAAIQNMLLMAKSVGLGACWASYTSDSGLIIREGIVRDVLNIPDHFKIAGIVAVGRPAESVCPIPRRDIDDLVSLNKYRTALQSNSGKK